MLPPSGSKSGSWVLTSLLRLNGNAGSISSSSVRRLPALYPPQQERVLGQGRVGLRPPPPPPPEEPPKRYSKTQNEGTAHRFRTHSTSEAQCWVTRATSFMTIPSWLRL